MAKRNPKQQDTPCRVGRPVAASIGAVLLELHKVIRRAERCRRTLRKLGFSNKRWQEIVLDVDPELRFIVRPKILDAIVIYLRSAGEPVSRESLVHKLSAQAAVALRLIRQSITANLHSRNLVLYPDNKIGLPEWMKRD